MLIISDISKKKKKKEGFISKSSFICNLHAKQIKNVGKCPIILPKYLVLVGFSLNMEITS